MCQVCCRHRLSWPSNPLCCQFSWWAHCREILFLLQSYSDCLCVLCVVFLCFCYHKSFHSIFAFLGHQLCLYAPKIVVVYFWWFWVGIFCMRPFPVLLRYNERMSRCNPLFAIAQNVLWYKFTQYTQWTQWRILAGKRVVLTRVQRNTVNQWRFNISLWHIYLLYL